MDPAGGGCGEMSGGPGNGALISASLRKMSGRISAAHAATDAP